MNTTTLETLPGEGEVKTIVKTRVRRECENCGEPAHYKHTFLLEGTRRNPASSAYGRDDCTWCEDECRYECRECNAKSHISIPKAPGGYVWCSTFPANERFAHMFLKWNEREVPNAELSEPI